MDYKIKRSPIELGLSEMPQSFADKAEILGVEAANSLLWYLPGFQIVSVPTRFKKYHAKMRIVEEYDGTNMSSLAVRFNMNRDDVLKIYNKYAFGRSIELPKPSKYIDCVADKCGRPVADLILEEFAGENFNVPSSGKRIMLAKKIRRGFRGDNHIELAAENGISVQVVYRIVA